MDCPPNPMQVWLQEFVWQEKDRARKLWLRAGHISSSSCGTLKHEPLFCFGQCPGAPPPPQDRLPMFFCIIECGHTDTYRLLTFFYIIEHGQTDRLPAFLDIIQCIRRDATSIMMCRSCCRDDAEALLLVMADLPLPWRGVCLSGCLSVCLSVCLSACLSVCLGPFKGCYLGAIQGVPNGCQATPTHNRHARVRACQTWQANGKLCRRLQCRCWGWSTWKCSPRRRTTQEPC
jgi:hypothetical protein